MSTLSKSKRLGLTFPYDWSNTDISDEAFALNVLERGIYVDICKVAAHYGLPALEKQIARLLKDVASSPGWLG